MEWRVREEARLAVSKSLGGLAVRLPEATSPLLLTLPLPLLGSRCTSTDTSVSLISVAKWHSILFIMLELESAALVNRERDPPRVAMVTDDAPVRAGACEGRPTRIVAWRHHDALPVSLPGVCQYQSIVASRPSRAGQDDPPEGFSGDGSPLPCTCYKKSTECKSNIFSSIYVHLFFLILPHLSSVMIHSNTKVLSTVFQI